MPGSAPSPAPRPVGGGALAVHDRPPPDGWARPIKKTAAHRSRLPPDGCGAAQSTTALSATGSSAAVRWMMTAARSSPRSPRAGFRCRRLARSRPPHLRRRRARDFYKIIRRRVAARIRLIAPDTGDNLPIISISINSPCLISAKDYSWLKTTVPPSRLKDP
jgi:hypothetical protein